MKKKSIVPILIEHNLISPEQEFEYNEYLDNTGGWEYA